MSRKKHKYPLDLTEPGFEHFIRDAIIPLFAKFRTTTQVVNFVMESQEKYFVKEVHKSRNEMREMIRTMNPHNAKFNRAKWGELFDECRQEFVSDLRSQIGATASMTTNLIYNAIKNARLQITTIKDLHEAVKLLAMLEKLSSKNISEPDLEKTLLELNTIPIQPIDNALEAIPERETHATGNPSELANELSPGKNGQKKSPEAV